MRIREYRKLGSRNYSILSPPDWFTVGGRVSPAPLLDVSAQELWLLWLYIADNAPRTVCLDKDTETLTSHHSQTTRYLHFPDDIWAEIVPLDEQQSTIAVLSRSRHGMIDFGINQKRVARWTTRRINRAKAWKRLSGMREGD